MAIVQASIAEEVLSRQERAVIRGVYRAAQLYEALIALQKVSAVLRELVPANSAVKPESLKVAEPIALYLAKQIVTALESTKVPAPTSDKVPSSQK